MSNRYANLVGSKKISEDFNNINIGFDRVQADMDTKAAAASPALTGTPTAPTQPAGDNSTKIATTQYADRAAGKVQGNLDMHIGDKVVHVTQEDHDKLDGIQEGAEVNQNAFAKVNDIEAAAPSSQLFIVGGLGITVTTNPNTGEVTVTATGESAPGAHGSTHTEHGADPIPTATLTEGGLLSAAQFAEIVAHGELLDEHSAAITSLEDRLDTADTNELTLQPGVQIITAQRDARFNLESIKGKTEINGQGRIGIIGVENPYVMRISGNLLPPFYEWVAAEGNPSFISPYKVNVSNANKLAAEFPVISGKTYTLSVKSSAMSGRLFAYRIDTSEALLDVTGSTDLTGSFVVPQGVTRVAIRLLGTATDMVTMYDAIACIGSVAKPFRPREDAMLALQTDLYADPVTGSTADEIFVRDGQYFKLAKWKKINLLPDVIDSSSLGCARYTGYVQIGLFMPKHRDTSNVKAYMTKYNGNLLTIDAVNSPLPNGDLFNVGNESQAGYVWMTIFNTDSGWGDNYTPTTDEIKAYFMGWVMFNASAVVSSGSVGPSNPPNNFYNGTGTKGWARRSGNSYADGTSVLPVTQATGWTPYQLLYKLATPTVEPIMSEGCLTFTEGDNQIEVGTGIVLREGVKPFQNPSNGNTVINSTSPGQESSKVKYPVERFLRAYKSSLQDNAVWTHQVNDPYAYGKDRLYMTGGVNYDPSAAYSVTYLKLDKSPVVPITGSVGTNEKAQLIDLTAGVQEALLRVSVVEQKKSEKDTPGWIAPTLLNGWENFGGLYAPAGYMKDSEGFVHFRGLIRNGAVGQNMFVLPEGYRPKADLIIGVVSHNNTTYVPSAIKVTSTGQVIYLEGSFYHLPLECITPFLAEK
ncbi:hypothetical protein ACTHSJ_19065 [Paenibacillus cellulositrophicus]|uniref:hypothetical protein n=1 Tax=Paenibacillus cellulositrophicus TaxID=562959 RepID=UPI003F7D51FD